VTQKGGGEPRLYIRDLAALQSREVAAAAGGWQPFFSADGAWLGFFGEGQLQKVAVAGGSPVKIASAPSSFGATFLDDGSIVYVPNEAAGLMRILPGAGAPEPLTKPDNADNGYAHTWPQALPGGENILFSVFGKRHGLAVYSLKTRQWQFVVPNHTAGVAGAASGSSIRLFVSDQGAGVKTGLLNFARPAAVNTDVAVLDNVNFEAIGAYLRLGLAVSRSGSAVYFPGNSGMRSLVWVDRQGRAEKAIAPMAAYSEMALSPDSAKAAVIVNQDVWVYELAGGARHRLTFYADTGSNASSPAWSPDGARVIFAVNEGADYDIYAQPADGSRRAEPLLRRPASQFPSSIRNDGAVLFGESAPDHGENLFVLLPDGKVAPVHGAGRFNVANALFSPDGRRIAYQSDETGRLEVYVENYPGGEHRTTVSAHGGFSPVWRRDGRELFYVAADGVMGATVGPDGSFGTARKLFDGSPYYVRWHSYDPAADGRLLLIRREPSSIPRQVNVILNWREELDRLTTAR
jgi:eukaryotic-like serine/threonine-protein kinase